MISNVRDIVRLYNAVLLKLNMVGDEINFADIVMITLLELKQAAFYEWIRNHMFDLTQSSRYLFYSVTQGNSSIEKIRKTFSDEFDNLNLTISADECHKILSLLFPVYGKAVNSGGYYDNNRLIRDQRIGQQDKFARYFVLSIADNKIPRNVVNNAVSNYTDDELRNFIIESVANHNSGDLITEIEASLKDIDNERKKVVLEALIPGIKYLSDPVPGEVYYLSAKGRAEYLNVIIMKELGTDTSYQIMMEEIEKAEVGDLEALSYILDVMLISYDRIRQNQGFPQVVTEEQLDKLGDFYIKKALEIDKESNLLSLKYPLCYFIFQYFNEGKNYIKYIKDKIEENDLNKLLYLSQTMDKWSGTDENDYKDSQHAEREKFIPDGKLMKAIDAAVESGLIKNLNENQALKVAAYYIYHTNEAFERIDGVNEEECKGKLTEWGFYEETQQADSHEVEHSD